MDSWVYRVVDRMIARGKLEPTVPRNNVSISFQATYHPHWFTRGN